MKKTLLTIVLLSLFHFSYGQLEKGDIQLGGSILYSFQKNNGNDISNINFSPSAGLFISNSTAIGVQLGMGRTSFEAFDVQSGNLVENVTKGLQFGVYSRFHKTIIDNFYLFLQPSVAYSTGKNDQNGTEQTSKLCSISILPGMTYFLSPRFALDLTIGSINYQNNTVESNGSKNSSGSFNLNLNAQNLGLGLSYFIK